MAMNKPFHLLSLIFILVLIIPISHSRKILPDTQTPSAFSFIKDLQGCHKGNNTKGLHNLKHYLHQFGYLNYQNQTHLDDDDFDNALEYALKTYQKNYHVSPTGTLDAATVAKMTSPRCGVADIVDGVNTMATKKPHHHEPAKSIHTVANFAFLPNNPRWPASKTHLTYRFSPNTRADAIAPVNSAFRKWAAATHFTFSRVGNNAQSDLVVGFFSRNHGDGFPFEGPGGTLAHAFPPTNGRFHYDADENWVNGAIQGGFDMETVALHEIGHLLGLGHSEVQAAIMFSGIAAGRTKGLHQDDIQGIRALYGR
ncbi:metalloendoproteinase 5-MMP-like [Andrographis paniculata]|uniref:metalloendoproteinase 5-MMP-like n=1 Tax=Andrographis paniculata TaxID=175694 RepID=UPI0021E81FF7|nr:metalloendoproteinase 5-MMP-like [Andrographis paniculata]